MRFGKLSVLVLLLPLVVSCTRVSVTSDSEKYYELASALTKLSSAVEATVRYDSPPEDITDEQLLKLSTAHDPRILEPFTSYHLDIRVQDRHAVVLVCDADKVRGLFEDAGCSAKLDRHIWRESDGACQPALEIATICN